MKEISVRTELVGMGFFDLQSIFYQQLLLSCAVKTTNGVLFSVGVFVCLFVCLFVSSITVVKATLSQ